jgi:hypothetical protein
MDDYIAKPVTMDALRTLLKRWIGPSADVPLAS